MDLLTFTIMVIQSVNHIAGKSGFSTQDWRWETWGTVDKGIYIDATPTWPIGGLKFDMEGNRYPY